MPRGEAIGFLVYKSKECDTGSERATPAGGRRWVGEVGGKGVGGKRKERSTACFHKVKR
jgi:hypothetical protein